MGYNIYIGEAVLRSDEEYLEASYIVKLASCAEAPIFPGEESPEQSNARWPSYSGWADTVRRLGLQDLFQTELMAQHPGICRLLPRHKELIDAAIEAYQLKHPGAKPGWVTGKIEDAVLARGIWLQWWVDWALKHCKNPAIYNS